MVIYVKMIVEIKSNPFFMHRLNTFNANRPGGTLEVGVVDALAVEVCPVEARGRQVDGEAVGAAHLRRQEDLPPGAVHVGLLDERHGAPAAPVHQAVGRVQRQAEGKGREESGM